MKLEYKLTADDFIEFNWYIHWARPGKKVFRALFHAMPFVLVLIIILFNQISDPHFGPKEILFLIPALVFSWFGPKYMRWRMARTIRKKVEKGGYATQLTDRELTLGEDSVRLVTPDADNEVGWEKFQHWHETKAYVFLFLDKNQALLLPKRIMDEEKLARFRELLQEKIPNP